MKVDSLFILLADDDEDDCIFFRDALQEIRAKTDLTIVNDGSQLMQYLDNADNRVPDLVFLDLNMPVLNGINCLVEIRKKSRLKELAIAIYSTSSSDENVEEAFINGANIYIQKPNDFSVLKVILEHVITLNLQYNTSGLKKENFLLNINNIKSDEVSKT
jgi:CheY-like chemotaxis protein